MVPNFASQFFVFFENFFKFFLFFQNFEPSKSDETALTVKESTPEPSSDEGRAVPAFRPRVRLKRGRPPKRRIHSPLVELTNEPVNETVDETMNETMNETANLSVVAGGDFHVESKPQQKLLSNSQKAKVKRRKIRWDSENFIQNKLFRKCVKTCFLLSIWSPGSNLNFSFYFFVSNFFYFLNKLKLFFQ